MITFDTDVAGYEDGGPLASGLPSYEKWAATQRNPSRGAWARVTLENLAASYQRLPQGKQQQIRAVLTPDSSRLVRCWRAVRRYFDINREVKR